MGCEVKKDCCSTAGTCGSECKCGCKQLDERTAVLVFYREELLYDIKNVAYVEGDIMADEQQDAKHQTQDIGEEGNVDRVTRIMELVFLEAVERLYPYAKRELPKNKTAMLDDEFDEADEYGVRLTLPSTFSATSLPLLRSLIHEYIVDRCLADWLSITKPDAAANWLAKGEDSLTKAKATISMRRGKVRRPMKPF